MSDDKLQNELKEVHKKLEDIDQDPSMADFGSFIHIALDKFIKNYDKKITNDKYQELLDIAEEEAEDGNPIVGNVNGFILSVETDNSNPVGTLKRRFAVAKDTRGITLLKGEPSFSSSDQILIDELVFYIQQNNLKAF